MIVVEKWARNNGLGVNPSKTELVLFTRKYKVPNFRLPKLENFQLKLSGKAKFLGLILDSKLNWNLNVDERIKKAFNALYSCNKVIGKRWGLRPDMIYWIYKTVVIPILLYGALVWWTVIKKNYMISKLRSVQRSAGLCITGALRSTSTEELEAILCLVPIEERVKEFASRSAIRLSSLGLFKANQNGHSCIINDLNRNGLRSTDLDLILTQIVSEPSFSTVIPTRNDWNEQTVIKRNEISVFTDGSKMSSGTGAGYFCDQPSLSNSYRLPETCTVYQAEVLAIQKAAEHLLIEQVSNKDISFYIDNQAAIKSLGARTINSSSIRDCREVLQALCRQNRLRLCWVPGHSNIKGNEKADELAKKGSEDLSLVVTDVKMPLATMKAHLKDISWKLLEDRWENTQRNQIARQLWPKIDLKKRDFILKFNKSRLREIVGGVTGHCLLGEHATKLGIRNSTECRFCFGIDASENIEHVLCECWGLLETRRRIFGEDYFEDLEEASKVDLSKFWKFVNVIDIFGNK